MLPTTADGYPSYFARGNSSIAAEPPRRWYTAWLAEDFSPDIGGLHRYLPFRRDAGSSYFQIILVDSPTILGSLANWVQSEAIPAWGDFMPQCGTANSIGPAAAFTYERCSRGSRTQPYLQEPAFPGAGGGGHGQVRRRYIRVRGTIQCTLHVDLYGQGLEPSHRLNLALSPEWHQETLLTREQPREH